MVGTEIETYRASCIYKTIKIWSLVGILCKKLLTMIIIHCANHIGYNYAMERWGSQRRMNGDGVNDINLVVCGKRLHI